MVIAGNDDFKSISNNNNMLLTVTFLFEFGHKFLIYLFLN